MRVEQPSADDLQRDGHLAVTREFARAWQAARLESALLVGHEPCVVTQHLHQLRYQAQVQDLLDPTVDAGFQVYNPTALTATGACGWVFTGYAIPLYDAPQNSTWWWGAGAWYPNLGWHVWTTSTSTVYLQERCEWRIYFPPNYDHPLVPDEGGAPTALAAPTSHPAFVGGTQRYPDVAQWTASGRFNNQFFSFVRSQDGGHSFPVYGPEMSGYGTSKTVGWDEAGWTPTAIPSAAVRATSGGQQSDTLWIKYQDITVIDASQEIGWYLMIAVECRWMTDGHGSGDECCVVSCDGCTASWDEIIKDAAGNEVPITQTAKLPYTRLVLFASKSPDFPAGAVLGAPGDPSAAIVLLAPDEGADGPGIVWICPNECYQVPHAIKVMYEDRLLIYVPWQGHGKDAGLHLPQRVQTRYPADPDVYRNAGDKQRPIWNESYNGISCFLLSIRGLGIALDAMAASDSSFFPSREVIRDLVEGGYQGEVLLTDGSATDAGYLFSPGYPDSPESWNVPAYLTSIDPHWVYIDGELWVYWDTTHDGRGGTSNDQVRCARLVSSAVGLSLEASTRAGVSLDFVDVLKKNNSGTIFLTPTTCDLAFDLRELFSSSLTTTGPDFGRLTSDPDVVQLNDGTLRLSCFGSGGGTGVTPTPGDGLLVLKRPPRDRPPWGGLVALFLCLHMSHHLSGCVGKDAGSADSVKSTDDSKDTGNDSTTPTDDTSTDDPVTARCEGTWTELRTNKICGTVENGFLGISVAANQDGTQPIIAATAGDTFDLSRPLWTVSMVDQVGLTTSSKPIATLSSLPEEGVQGAGTDIDLTADVTGDGVDDVILSAPFVSISSAIGSGGRVMVYDGPVTEDRDLGDADATIDGIYTENYLGYCLTGVPDVNADGYDDLLVGTYVNAPPGIAGFFLGPLVDGTLADATATYGWDLRDIGVSVATADLDGDGASELLLGGTISTESDEIDAIFRVDPSLSGPVSRDDVYTLVGEEGQDLLTYRLLAADATGDGYDDLVVRADEGEDINILIFDGPFPSDNSTMDAPLASISMGGEGGTFASATIAGDLNGDGLSGDVVVGDINRSTLYFLPAPLAGTLTADDTAPLVVDSADTSLGYSLAPLPDLDADGYDDLLVGAPGDSALVPQGGALYTLFGDAW